MPSKTHLLLLFFFLATTFLNHVSAQEPEIKLNENNDKRWRIALTGGMGYRVASSKDSKQLFTQQGFDKSQVDSYFKGIKWGPKASAQVHYLFKENYGIGIDYQFHYGSGSMNGIIDPQDGVTLYYGELKDKIFTNYIGLSLYEEIWVKPEVWNFYAQASFGITYFRQENETFYSPVLITGKAPGINAEAGLDYFITPRIAVGANLNCFLSTISKIKVDDGTSTTEIKLEDKQREGLSRLDAGVGLRFYF